MVWKNVLSFVAALTVAIPSFAQNYPMPSKVGQPAAICTGCTGINSAKESSDGKPTYPYAAPLTAFVGRIVDSNNTAAVQNVGQRVARASRIRMASNTRGSAPPRIYMRIGEALGGYTLSSFFTTKLAAGMLPINAIDVGYGYGRRNPFERVSPYDVFFYPESKYAGWLVPVADNEDRLLDFDFDDRGYLYMAQEEFGWGITKDSGESGTTHLPSIVQMIQDPIGRPNYVPWVDAPRVTIALKNGSSYSLVISNGATTDPPKYEIWDVTNPANPTRGITASTSIEDWAKNDDAKVVAILGGGQLRLYTYSAFLSGGAPFDSVAPSIPSKFLKTPVFDEQGNLWVLESTANPATTNVIYKLTPNGSGGYTKLTLASFPGSFAPRFMHAGAGYVAVGGLAPVNGATANELLLFKDEGTSLRLLDTDNFFRKYYHSAPAGYAQPGSFSNFPVAVAVIKQGTKTYLIYNSFGLGDVYQLGADGPQLAATMKSTFGTPNPNAKPTQTGPFPGDVVTFGATVTPAATHTLTWNFGNPEAGSENIRSGSTGIDISHQFSGLNTAAKITTTKNVTATSISDSQITNSVPVVLKVPEARIALKSTGQVITGSSFEAIVGDKFVDASDGSVESHVATWTIGATPSALRPNDEIDVGALGSRSVSLKASYGKYDANTMVPNAQSFDAIVSAKGYEVKPFIAKLNPATRNGSTVTYSATARATTDVSALSATQWTATWTVVNGNSTVATQSNQVAVGTVPPFSFDKALLATGTIVKLVLSVDPQTVPSITYASYEVSETITLPDPVIELTNCNFVNDNCSIKAVAGPGGGSAASWQLSWVVKFGNQNVATGTGNPLATFKLNNIGQHTVTVTETVFDVSKTTSFNVGGVVCGPPPTPIQLAINPSCTTCQANATVTFRASLFQYLAQDCDVYSWNFGDGNTGSGSLATHAYTAPGNYTVSLKVSNSNNPTGTTVTKQITVPGGNTCTAPTNITFSWGTCTTNCKTNDSVKFTATRGNNPLQSCDQTTWTFGDGSASTTTKSPNHTFSSPNTYTVTLVVQNEKGTSSPVVKTISIAPATTGCNAGPNVANVTLSYTGKESGCTKNNGVACRPNEEIQFNAGFFQYTLQACDRFEWTWGDGTPAGTAQNPTHTYAGGLGSATVSLKVYNTATPAGVTLQANVSFGAPAKPLPVLSFASFPTTGAKGNPVTFTVNSNIDATGWQWDFGDGKKDTTTHASHIGTSASIQHVYTSSGTFQVSVKARNAADIATAQNGVVLANNPGIIISDIPEYKYLLPVVTHSGGQNNSVWRTDVQIFSDEPGLSLTNPLRMTATLRDINRTLEIFSSTTQYVDFMKVFTNATDSGPVVITVRSLKAPQIWTRTYNQTDAGTFGQFIPAVRIDAAAGAGSAFGTGKYYMAGLRHDARFRTNLGFINPNSQAINATVKVFDDQRFPLGQFTLQLQPFTLDQFPITADKAVKNLPPGRPFSVEVEVPPGQWLIGYASFIDNASSDPVYIQAIRESELTLTDYSNGIIPGVGHAGEWRSDVTIFNPDTQGVNVDLTYYDGNGNKVAEAKSIPIRGGEFLQYTDFLKQGVFGTVGDSVGMLRVTVPTSPSLPAPGRFPLTFARTYNDKGTGKTFGQGIGGFAAGRANVKVGKPALVPGVRSDADYYTNIGLVNPGTVDAVVIVKLLDPATGAEQTLSQHTMKPNQTLVGRVELGTLETGSLKVEVTTGSVWAFCSIVDKGTADPEYIPATPLVP